jgi:hypothetical protein
MIKTIHSFLFIITLSISSYSFAQLDGSFGNKKDNNSSFDIISAPTKKVEKPKSLGFKNNSGFKTAHAKQQKEYQKKQADIALKNKGVITPELLRKITLQKQAEKYSFEIPMIDKDLGIFRTTSNGINISAYDFGILDGDVVSIYINDIIVKENYMLLNFSKTISIPLEMGFNKVVIKAVDEGKLRPNTGAFTVFDNYGAEVISNMWTLAKGAKVIALIIREEKKE